MQDSETPHRWGHTVKVASSYLPVGSLAELQDWNVTLPGKGVKKWLSHVEREGAVVANPTPGANIGVVFGASAGTKVKEY